MKEIGILLVVIAATALGITAGDSLRKRYRSWVELKILMNILKGQLQYGADPLNEVFRKLGERTEGCFSNFFRRTAKAMEERCSCSLEALLQENARIYLKMSGLSRREQEQLVRICAMIGQMSRESQISVLEGYLFTIQQEETAALEKVRQKETMYRCLGLMGGLFFAILLY